MIYQWWPPHILRGQNGDPLVLFGIQRGRRHPTCKKGVLAVLGGLGSTVKTQLPQYPSCPRANAPGRATVRRSVDLLFDTETTTTKATEEGGTRRSHLSSEVKQPGPPHEVMPVFVSILIRRPQRGLVEQNYHQILTTTNDILQNNHQY